jgi:hypothetical protein
MISGLGVMSFRTSTRLLHFCADRIEQSVKPELLTQNNIQYQKTLNIKLVANFLHFPTVIYMTSYDKRSRSYDVLNIDQAAEISVLGRFECSEKSAIVTPKPMHSQEIFHNTIVDNILSFLTHPHSTYLVMSNQSYRNRKTVRKHEFRRKPGNRFGVVAR